LKFGHLTNQEMAGKALRFAVFLTAIFLCNGVVFMTLLFIYLFVFSNFFLIYDPLFISIYFHESFVIKCVYYINLTLYKIT
jgi:hypothetical protein